MLLIRSLPYLVGATLATFVLFFAGESLIDYVESFTVTSCFGFMLSYFAARGAALLLWCAVFWLVIVWFKSPPAEIKKI